MRPDVCVSAFSARPARERYARSELEAGRQVEEIAPEPGEIVTRMTRDMADVVYVGLAGGET